MSIIKKAIRKAEKIPALNYFLANHFFYNNYKKKTGQEEIKGCFVNRPQENNVGDEIFIRIINAYQKTIAEKIDREDIFTVTNEWKYIYRYYMQDIMPVLQSGDIPALRKAYSNFMREKCSTGLHGLAIDMHSNFFAKPVPGRLHSKMYLNDSNYRFDLWKSSFGNNGQVKALYMPEYGNSYGYYKDDNYIRTGAEYLHYYASSIKNLLSESGNNRKTIMEIGGGYGGLAYFLNKNIEKLTYVDFDLPENMALTSYYLMCCFPQKKIMLYGEDTLDNIDNYDIVVLPNFCIDSIKENSADLIFNSYSLAEMAPATIQYYVARIKAISKKYIFHVNHTNKSTSINADNFGFDADSEFLLIYRAKAMWNMYRNYRCDEYEYLYKKNRQQL
ncbi:MAG: putative sugar O-methyltransferase [Ferruginibacter sp.]|nr:putative sugar O-methyltransferase [Ferruginibacter sp.]